jgi:hypothetical protein
MNRELHASATLHPEKEPSVPCGRRWILDHVLSWRLIARLISVKLVYFSSVTKTRPICSVSINLFCVFAFPFTFYRPSYTVLLCLKYQTYFAPIETALTCTKVYNLTSQSSGYHSFVFDRFRVRVSARLPDILRFSCFFCPSRQIAGQYLKLGHGSFLPYTFQFIIIPSSDAVLCYWQHR